MMFTKPNAIIYVRRSGLIAAGKRLTPARLNFPADVVNNLEVLSSNRLITGCQKFFTDHSMRNKHILVVLDTSVVFSKSVDFDETGRPDVITQSFIDAMPFNSGQRACVRLQTPSQLKLYATNADLYQAIIEALRLSGAGKLVAITPAPAYELRDEAAQLGNAIQQFISDTKVRTEADFANVTPV